MQRSLNPWKTLTKQIPVRWNAPGAGMRQVRSAWEENCTFLGCLLLICALSVPVKAQVDQKCVQQCQASTCIAGDISQPRLQQCRATCVKSCTKPSSVAQGAATAQPTGYMKITAASGAIAGDSKESAHQGWIELRSFQHDMTQLATAPAGATLDGKGTLTMTKAIDKSSALLQKACASGEHLPEVVVDVYRGGKALQRLTLSDVQISSFHALPGDSTAESVSLNYIKIKF